VWWLWKHRRAWKQLKELWENRVELIRFMRYIDSALNLGRKPTDKELQSIGERANDYVKWIRRTGIVGIPLVRPWPYPPPSPRQNANDSDGIEKACASSTTGQPYPFRCRLDSSRRVTYPGTKGIDGQGV